MSKLTRNTSDPQSREFWESVDRGAAEIANAPTWMKAGITLNARQFETFPAQQDALAHVVGRSSEDE